MNDVVFASLAKSYFQAGKNLFYYVDSSDWMVKPFTFILALLFNIILIPVGLVFWFLIIFDYLGGLVDNIRRYIIVSIDNHSWRISNSFLSFIFRLI